MTPKTILLALLLLTPVASADDGEEPTVEVWDEPRTVPSYHVVLNDTTLVIRGVPVTIGAGLVVAPRGKLVLEPGPDGSPAILQAASSSGWTGGVLGEMLVSSAGGSPAVLDGLSGTASASRETILYEGGFTVGGLLHGDGLVVRNYSAALNTGPTGRIDLHNVTFNASWGYAVVLTGGQANLTDATFQGFGAGVWNAAEGTFRVTRGSFEGVDLPLMHLGKLATVEDSRATDALRGCVRAAKGALVVRGLDCEGFLRAALDVSKPSQGIGRPRADIAGLRATTDNATADGILIEGVEAVSVSDSLIGPLGGHGIQARRLQPTLRNVSFQGVGGYNVFLLDLAGAVREGEWSQGEPGGRGRAYVGARFHVKAFDANGAPAEGARIELRVEPEEVTIGRAVLPENGQSEPFLLDVLTIGKDDQRRNFTYHVVAQDATGKLGWERRGYVPDGDALLFNLVDPLPAKETPFPLAFVLVAIALAGLMVRSFRRV